ncbi:MAG: tetratricopeptide repeat protein [Candidatus Hodarchaeota archaeon]
MVQRKINKWLAIFIVTIIYIILVAGLRLAKIISELTFIFLISIIPIILINLYFILEKEISPRFKIILPVFSSIFIIAYCYIFLFFIPSKYVVIKKFSDEEFGILLYDTIEKDSKIRIDLKNIRKRLKQIKTKTLIMNKSIRIEMLNGVKVPDSEVDFDAFIQKEINNLNASIGIVLYKVIDDSVYSKIYSTSKFIESGLPKTVFMIISSPFKLADLLKENIESLLTITKIDSLDIVEPVTPVEKTIVSNLLYERSTKILEKIFDIPEDSPERHEKIKKAETELKKSIKVDSLNDRSLAMIAFLKNIEESKHDSAAIYYEKAKQIQPQSYAYTWNLAQSYYLAGVQGKAINTLKEYLDNYGNMIEDVPQKLEMEKLLRSYQEGK